MRRTKRLGRYGEALWKECRRSRVLEWRGIGVLEWRRIEALKF
ncbi:hypothetical protein M6D81_17195 [Paenibacillus sp. J5C_2022]|nr:hypothetical protein [Paenibacillus sp. J5C2022]